MSVECEPILADDLWTRLSPDAALIDNWTMLLLTVSADGHPHQAMLSCGEVVANNRHVLDLAIWSESTAARNLEQRPLGTITTVVNGTSWALYVVLTAVSDVTVPRSKSLRHFRVQIVRVTSDRAPYALLQSGVTFQLTDPGATRARWSELRAALSDQRS